MDDILYVTREGRKTFLITRKQEYTLSEKYDVFCECLPQGFFYPVHKSFFVNLHYVERYSYTELLLTSGISIPIAPRRQSAFHKFWFEYLRRRYCNPSDRSQHTRNEPVKGMAYRKSGSCRSRNHQSQGYSCFWRTSAAWDGLPSSGAPSWSWGYSGKSPGQYMAQCPRRCPTGRCRTPLRDDTFSHFGFAYIPQGAEAPHRLCQSEDPWDGSSAPFQRRPQRSRHQWQGSLRKDPPPVPVEMPGPPYQRDTQTEDRADL